MLQFSKVITSRLPNAFHGKPWLAPVALALFVVALNGCGNFFTSDNGSSGGSTGGTPKFVFVSNFNSGGAGSVSAFTVDSSTGALTAVTGSPFSSGAGSGPVGIAADSGGNFVFMPNQGGGISSFQVNRNSGALAGAAGSPFTAGNTPAGIAASADGSLIYVSNSSSADIYGYRVSSSAALTSVGTAVPATGVPGSMFVDPSARFLYVAMGSTGVQVFSIGSGGALTSVRTVPPSPCAGASAVVTDSNSRFAFIPDGVGSICTYAVNASNGDLLLITSTPVSTGSQPDAVAITPDNAHLYVANVNSSNVSAYTINTDGTLTGVAGSPFSVGTSPSSLAVDPSGKFLYVADFGDSALSVLSISSSGALSQSSTVATGVGPSGIVVTP